MNIKRILIAIIGFGFLFFCFFWAGYNFATGDWDETDPPQEQAVVDSNEIGEIEANVRYLQTLLVRKGYKIKIDGEVGLLTQVAAYDAVVKERKEIEKEKFNGYANEYFTVSGAPEK